MPDKTPEEVEFEKAEKKKKADDAAAKKKADDAKDDNIIKAMHKEFERFEGSMVAKLPGMDALLDGFRELITAAEETPPKSEEEVEDLVKEHVPDTFLSMCPGWITLMQPAMEGLFEDEPEVVAVAEGSDASEK